MFKLLRVTALVLLPVLLALPASADTYPSRVVRIIVPFGAGGPADVYARILAQHLSRRNQAVFRGRGPPGRRLARSAPTRSRNPRPTATRCW